MVTTKLDLQNPSTAMRLGDVKTMPSEKYGVLIDIVSWE